MIPGGVFHWTRGCFTSDLHFIHAEHSLGVRCRVISQQVTAGVFDLSAGVSRSHHMTFDLSVGAWQLASWQAWAEKTVTTFCWETASTQDRNIFCNHSIV